MGGWALAELDWDLGELQRPPIEDLLEAMSFFIYNVKINKRALGRLQESSYRGFIGSNVFLCLNVKINRRALKALATVKRSLQQVVPISEGALQVKTELPKLDSVAAKIVVPTPAAVAG